MRVSLGGYCLWAEVYSTVIASEAKQSMALRKGRMDCFVAYAPRNDGELADAAMLGASRTIAVHSDLSTFQNTGVAGPSSPPESDFRHPLVSRYCPTRIYITWP